MELITIFFIAIGLSLDSFAVSITNGLILPKIKFFDAVKISLSLAFFQGIFPLIGWIIGSKISYYFRDIDHWIAFVILAALGTKMITESLKESDLPKDYNPLKLKVMVSISIATSIDALIVGLGLGLFETNIFYTCFIIGFITFFFGMLGTLIGKKTGDRFGQKMETIGGIILILIGLKILIEHLIAHYY